jgi:hypothetical protein
VKTFNLEKAVGVLANIGVIAGIIFLAVELQQNNRLLRNEAIGSVLETRMVRQELRLNNPGLNELIAKNRRGEALSDADRMNLNSWYVRALLGWERDYFLFREGILSEAMFRGNVLVMKNSFLRVDEAHNALEHWNVWQQYASPGFREFVRQCIISECDEIPR